MEKNVDEIIKRNLKESYESNSLSSSFNEDLFSRLKPKSKSVSVFSDFRFILSIGALIIILTVISFCYFVLDFSSIQLEYDLSFMSSNGAKYMIYAFSAMLFFALLDRLLQINTKLRGNN